MKPIVHFAGALLAASLSTALWAQTVDVKDAWVRATVPSQKATGAFMTLSAKEGGKLVGVFTPVAAVAEVHEMKMDGDVMKMRALTGGLDLPAGTAVELKPGGFHVMLMDLKTTLLKDSRIPMTLVFKDAKGAESKMELKVPVLMVAPVMHDAAHGMAHGEHAKP